MWLPLFACLLLGGTGVGAPRLPRAPDPAWRSKSRPIRGHPKGIHRPASPAAPSHGRLLTELSDDDPKLRADAAWEVGRQRLLAAKPVLGKLLRDREAPVRRNAAWALGELGRPESAFPLHDRLLREPNPTVQAELAIALGKVRYRAARPLLLGLTWKSDPVLQAAGITAVGYLSDPSAMSTLLRFQSSPDPMLRRALAEALGRTGGRDARSVLLKLLGDPATAVQVAALEAVSRLGIAEAAPWAERHLEAGHAELRQQAAATLRSLGSRKHLAALATRLGDEHPEVAAEAALTLAHLGGRLPSSRLRELLASKHNAALRAATQAAGLAGNRETVPQLESLLEHPSPRLRAAAAEALGRLAASQSLPKLLSRLSEAPSDELATLLGAIGALRDASTISAVAPLLSHPDVEVRAASVLALRQMAIGDPRPFAFLSRLLIPLLGAHQPPALLVAAADVFARLPSPRPREGFIALMRLTLHLEAGVRSAAAQGLGKHGDPLARPALERLRRDHDPAVRLETSLALLRLDALRGRGTRPEALLPDCDQQPKALRTRCLILRAAWLPRERGVARKAFLRALQDSPNSPESALLVDWTADLDAAFSLPLLQEARRAPSYLLRAAAERALSIWPPLVPRPPRHAPPPRTGEPEPHVEDAPLRRRPETPLFDPGAPREGCGCSFPGGGGTTGIPWLLLVLALLCRAKTAESALDHLPSPPGPDRPA